MLKKIWGQIIYILILIKYNQLFTIQIFISIKLNINILIYVCTHMYLKAH